MIAIVCDTTYQLMNAIFLADHLDKNGKLVLFLNQAWQKTTRKFDLDNMDGRIHRIYYYSQKQMGALHLFTSLYHPEKMLASLDGYDSTLGFSAVIAPRTGWIATYLMDYLQQKSGGAKLFLIEEGLGEYNTRMAETRFTKMAHRLKKKCHTDMVEKAYFTAPEIYPFETGFPIEKLPADLSNTGLVDFMIRLFKAEDDIASLRPYKFILLNQTSNWGDFDAPYRTEEEKMAAFIANVIKRDDYAVKLHPRAEHFNVEGVPCLYTQCPFELFAAKVNMEERVMISTLSTAMLTPKLMFDEEPYLVFTYRLAEDVVRAAAGSEEVHQNNIRAVKNACALYRNQDRLFFPATYDEFGEQLKEISRRVPREIR